jgi:hypothetical protein
VRELGVAQGHRTETMYQGPLCVYATVSPAAAGAAIATVDLKIEEN